MTNEELVKQMLEKLGGKDNVRSATNCQTRLRVQVSDDAKIDEAGLKGIEGVLGIVHDRPGYIEVVVGPGKCRKCADICHDMGISSNAADAVSTNNDWKTNKSNVKAGQKPNKVRDLLKVFGEIFVPLIPGVIAAGLCAGIATLIKQLVPGFADNTFLNVLVNLLGLINSAFLAYLTAWAGYRAAERFGGTPILGGMLGMITGLDGINVISQAIGWFNADVPLDSILRSGRGGVLAAVIGVYFMVKIEKAIRRKMPDSLDIVFTPILTLIITLIPYIFVVMPVCGLISSGLCWIVQVLCMSSNIVVRVIAGYVSAALFLPMVAMGMHHGLVALYSVQLEQFGYVMLYPALAMAGAGQVGAAIAIARKAKKVGNERMRNVIRGALPAGFLGVGEPLIYGVTLPMGKPFITAGLGAGFGGAFAMATEVAATTWGPSGLLALFVMTAGPHGAVNSVLCYGVGLVISYVMGYVITNLMVKDEEVANA
ncbi:MAG: PTS transporter subunit EIIC [Galactobacillus timonensis]|uniref:PTS transporter subunit EIIC n=1 Tax=Galactobacillus timonensis TaxID=2041840 RepID=UPI0023F0BA94|nr:PTS transporter subunit EIIC [Galactobacillus timonensis]MCI6067983.1 PTS transporter subunit EIIC [Galactobacillus timonensis]